MSIAAVIGAGSLGGAVAFKLAERDHFREVRLIDRSGGAAAGTALDIQQAGALVPFATRVTAGTDVELALGARLAIFADSAEPSEDRHRERTLATIRRLARQDPALGFICAGPGDLPVVELAVREGSTRWTQIVGSAPAALASAVRALVALDLDRSPHDVSLTLLGIPPADLVVPWSQVTMAGDAVDRRLGPNDLRRLERRIHRLWPPGPLSLASAAARVAEAIALGSSRIYCCSVTLSGEFGARERALVVPIRLGPPAGVCTAVPELLAQERLRVENALDLTA